jgi:DNA-binding NarL/FixJ family response regulator
MRAILVGSARDRARLRSALEDLSIDIVGEFQTVADARRSGTDADAVITAPRAASGDQDRDARPFGGDDPPADALTPREMQVLELLAEGRPNKAIAEQLGISDQTVKFHVSSISGKLGAVNRTDAVRRAVRRGLIAL